MTRSVQGLLFITSPLKGDEKKFCLLRLLGCGLEGLFSTAALTRTGDEKSDYMAEILAADLAVNVMAGAAMLAAETAANETAVPHDISPELTPAEQERTHGDRDVSAVWPELRADPGGCARWAAGVANLSGLSRLEDGPLMPIFCGSWDTSPDGGKGGHDAAPADA